MLPADAKAKTGWRTTHSPEPQAKSKRQRVDEANRAASRVLDESGMGFDVFAPRGQAPTSGAWDGSAERRHGAEMSGVDADSSLPHSPTWLVHVDPTGAFVSVALVVSHVPGVGAVYDVAADVVYSARHRGVVLANGKPLEEARAPRVSPLNAEGNNAFLGSPIVTNITPPDAHETDAYREHVSGTISNLLRAGHFNIRMESCPAQCLLMVATGKAVVYWACGPHASEVAAGLVIARVSGAIATNPGSSDDTYRAMLSPTWTAIAAAEAREKGHSGEPKCDITARRFAVGVSASACKQLEGHLAGPIPYAVSENEHPLAGDLQLRKVVLGMDPEEPSTSLEPLYTTPRWSDSPAADSQRRWSDSVPPSELVSAPTATTPGRQRMTAASTTKSPAHTWSVLGSLRRTPREEPTAAAVSRGYDDDGYLNVASGDEDDDDNDDGSNEENNNNNNSHSNDDDDDEEDNSVSVPPPPRPVSRHEAERRRLSLSPGSDGVETTLRLDLGTVDENTHTHRRSLRPIDDYTLTALELEETARELRLGRPVDSTIDTNGWVDGDRASAGRVEVRVQAPRVKAVVVAPAAAREETNRGDVEADSTAAVKEAVRPDVRRIRVRSYLDD